MKFARSTSEDYERLYDAIIIQASEDYRRANKRLAKFPYDKRAQERKDEVLDFFYSEWFSALTTLDPQILIDRLDAECK